MLCQHLIAGNQHLHYVIPLVQQAYIVTAVTRIKCMTEYSGDGGGLVQQLNLVNQITHT